MRRKIIVWLSVVMMLGMQTPTACVNDAQTDWGGAHGNVKKNLILGTQKGLLPHEVRVFLASLRAVACHAEVVIFSAEKGGRVDLEDLAETFGARIIEYDFERLSAQYGPMNLHRFHLFEEFLRRAGPNAYAQVLMCDIRDVFFQLDPFDALAVAEGLGVAIEPRHLSIAACDIHARWLSDECVDYKAERVLEAIGDKSRSCAGTTIGTQAAVHEYCGMMLKEGLRTRRQVNETQARPFEGRITTFDGHNWWGWCNDQAMHNVLLWTGQLTTRFKVKEYGAEDSPLATVGTMKVIRTNTLGELVLGCEDAANEDCDTGQVEVVAALVHQYDRVDVLVKQVEGLYGLEGEVFQTFQQRYSIKRES